MTSTLRATARQLMRVALSHEVLNGLSVAFGLLLISATVRQLFGDAAAAAAMVGAIIVIPPDLPAPRHGKFWHLLPAALIGPPLFWAVQLVHADPLRLAALLVPASFIAFLGAAWGKRGLPISVSIMFAMVFSMAAPVQAGENALHTSLWCAAGAAAYLVYATAANAALNARYRAVMVADTLVALAALVRTQSRQLLAPQPPSQPPPTGPAAPLIGRVLRQQAALADQLQAARDIVLESPRTPRRRRLAGLLLAMLEMRDHLVACELDLDRLLPHADRLPLLADLGARLDALGTRAEALADALLAARKPAPPPAAGAAPAGGVAEGEVPAAVAGLARGLAWRVARLENELARMAALARGDVEPDVDTVRAGWQLFVSPTRWSWRPFTTLWRWDAPPLRHAVRAAVAIAAGQAVSMLLPWGTHDYWILLTITVVLRGSLAQTLERRNARVAGTLLGCVLSGALLYAHVPAAVLLAVVTLAQGIAHAFTLRRYFVTAVAATVLGLVQAHLLSAGTSPVFELAERIADTLIGAAIAWAASYVLPSWERSQLPALVKRALVAQSRHAKLALGLGAGASAADDLAWRLARREVYDSLSALVQATQRSLVEPRAVQPPLDRLGRLIGHGYQLLAQLTAVKSMLLQRGARLDVQRVQAPARAAATAIAATLEGSAATPGPAPDAADLPTVADDELPDPFEADLGPWLLRRLRLATAVARSLRDDAQPLLPAPRGPRAAADGAQA